MTRRARQRRSTALVAAGCLWLALASAGLLLRAAKCGQCALDDIAYLTGLSALHRALDRAQTGTAAAAPPQKR
jgi:hypothetical protein